MLRLKTTSPCRMRKKLQRRNRPTEQFVEGISTHRNLQGGHGFCCLQLSSFRRWGTEGSGKKAKRCNQSGEVPWQYDFLCKLQADFTKASKPCHTTAFKNSWNTFFNSQMYLEDVCLPCIPTLSIYSILSWWFQSPLEAATVVSSFPSSGRCWHRIKEGKVEERTIRDKGDQEGGLDSSWFKNINLCGCFRK